MLLVKYTGLIAWLLLAVHNHASGFDGPPCEGARDSIRGVKRWNDTSLRCCAARECFGYDVKSVAQQVTGLLEARLHSPLPLERQKPMSRSGRPSSLSHGGKDRRPEAPCCSSSISVIFPLSGYSAVTGERVTVLQIGPFRQPVVYEKCNQSPCRFLRGNCSQVYTPLPLYVMANASDGRLGAELDYVLVESGCRCRQPDEKHRSGVRMGVDRTVKDALRVVTGFDLNPDQLIDQNELQGLQETTATSFPLVMSTTTLSTSKPLKRTEGPAEMGRPQVTGKPLKTVGTTTDTATISTSTTHSTVAISKATVTGRPNTTVKITRRPRPTRSTRPSTKSPVPSTTTAAMTTEAPEATLLPLPSLPPPGEPLEIKPGFFNPVSLLLKPYLSRV